MSAELQLLRIDNENEIRPVSVSSMDLDQRLESILVSNIRFLDPNLMLVGHQITTLYHGQIDLLAIDSDGKMWVIALKKDRIPRDIISQLLDYGSWIAGLNYSQIKDLYEKYNTDSFEAAFENAFGLTPPETINEAHQLVLVSSTLDPVAERIMGYLTDFGLNINAIQFSYFGDEQREYLSRRWYRDPKALDHADSLANKNTKKEAWNGHDYYVTFDENHQRHWEDAVKYGFISAGGAKRHSNALKQLAAGDRVFVNIPNTGYVAVGIVEKYVQPVSEFYVKDELGHDVRLLDQPIQAHMGEHCGNPDLEEQVVGITWLRTLTKENAFREQGFFTANQQSVCKFRNQFTLDKLIERFGVAQDLTEHPVFF